MCAITTPSTLFTTAKTKPIYVYMCFWFIGGKKKRKKKKKLTYTRTTAMNIFDYITATEYTASVEHTAHSAEINIQRRFEDRFFSSPAISIQCLVKKFWSPLHVQSLLNKIGYFVCGFFSKWKWFWFSSVLWCYFCIWMPSTVRAKFKIHCFVNERKNIAVSCIHIGDESAI